MLFLYIVFFMFIDMVLCEMIVLNENNPSVRLHSQIDESNIKYTLVYDKPDGWIGVGFSTTGSMMNAEMSIMTGYDVNRYISRTFGMPKVQPNTINFEVLDAGRNNSHSWFSVRRPKRPCNENEFEFIDVPIYILWAGGMENLSLHNEKGMKLVNLINGDISRLPNTFAGYGNIKSYSNRDIDNFKHSTASKPFKLSFSNKCDIVKGENYKYFGFDFSDFSQAYVGGIEINEDTYIHHANIYLCGEREYMNFMNVQNVSVMPECVIIMTWSKGSFFTGYPFNTGAKLYQKYKKVIIEYHLVNTEMNDVIDHQLNTDMIIFLNKPENEVGVISSSIPFKDIYIPAKSITTHVTEFPNECLANNAYNKHKVFTVAYHGHKALKSIIVRHFRGDFELKPLLNIEAYDFNHQIPERKSSDTYIYNHDRIVINCTYDTIGLNHDVIGGFKTSDEMCIVALVVSPPPKYGDLIGSMSVKSTYCTSFVSEIPHFVDSVPSEPFLDRPYPRKKLIECSYGGYKLYPTLMVCVLLLLLFS